MVKLKGFFMQYYKILVPSSHFSSLNRDLQTRSVDDDEDKIGYNLAVASKQIMNEC